VIDSVERGKIACVTVGTVFRERPWVTAVWETKQNSRDDVYGYDMFVRAKYSFLKMVRMGGVEKLLPIQIKSSDRRLRAFVRKYTPQMRFFNVAAQSHQFVLCGMDEVDFILADMVGQLVAHVSSFGVTEKETLSILKGFGDQEACLVYKSTKGLLLRRWYASRIPHFKK